MSMPTLSELITGALMLAGSDKTAHGGRLWSTEGGRSCPLGWEDCSQPVFVDLASGEYDYGAPGGPGHDDCRANCMHRMEPAAEPELAEDIGDADQA